MRCPDCGTINSEGAKYCNECGNRLPPTPSADEVQTPVEVTATPKEPLTQAETLLLEAREAARKGDVSQGLELSRRALIIEPGLADAHSLLGELYELLGEDSVAAAEYEAALEIDPEREHDGQRFKALRSPRRPVEAGKPEKQERFAFLWERPALSIGLTALAMVLLVAVVSVVAGRSQSSALLEAEFQRNMEAGRSNLEGGDVTGAVEAFRRAERLRPDDPEAEYWLAQAELMAGHAAPGQSTARVSGTGTPAAAAPGASGSVAARATTPRSPFKPIPLGTASPVRASSTGVTRATSRPSGARRRGLSPPQVLNDLASAMPSPTIQPGEIPPNVRPLGEGQGSRTPVIAKNVPFASETEEKAKEEPRGTEEQKPRGEIRISVSKRPKVVEKKPEPPPPGTVGHALRREAAQLYAQGMYHAAAEKYRQAIRSYEDDLKRGGAGVEPLRAAIRSSQRGLELCQRD